MTSPGMLIIGAGECGTRAAMELRKAKYTRAITIVGAEALPPYERPPLSKDVLMDRGDSLPKAVVDIEHLNDASITLRLASTVKTIDPARHTVELADRTVLAYEKLLIATGAEPRRLPLSMRASRRICYLRTFGEALNIGRRLGAGRHVAIIGGGVLGLEVAASARRSGAVVTVVEALQRVLARVAPEEIAWIVGTRHKQEGVMVRCGVSVVSIDERAEGVSITLSDGHCISADLLVIAVGAVPVVGIAESAGLEVVDGIVVDEYLSTSAPDIYAAGDCCSFPLGIYGGRRVRLESWRNAKEQGELAGRNMAAARESVSCVPWFWSDQYDLTLQIAGLIDEGVETVRRPIGHDAFVLFHLGSDGRLVAASGIGNGNVVARDIRLSEMLIAKGAMPTVTSLRSPDVNLRSLLVACAAKSKEG